MSDFYPDENPFIRQAREEAARHFAQAQGAAPTPPRRVLSETQLAEILAGNRPQSPAAAPAAPAQPQPKRTPVSDEHLAALIRGGGVTQPAAQPRIAMFPTTEAQNPFRPTATPQIEQRASDPGRALIIATQPSQEVAVVGQRPSLNLVPVNPSQPTKPEPRRLSPFEIVWSGGRKRKFISIGAIGLLATSGLMAKTDTTMPGAVTAAKTAFGLGEIVNNTVYSAPDCDKPLAYTDVASKGDMLLRMRVFTSLDDRRKLAADKNYKPQYSEGFFENQPDAQQQELPVQPFTTGGQLVKRLPQTIYAGRTGIAACFTTKKVGDVIKQDPNDPYLVHVDADKVQLKIASEEGLKQSYERYPVEIKKEFAANSPFPDGELQRQYKVLYPDAKKPAVMNQSILANIKANALEIFNAGSSCDKWITQAMQKALNDQLNEKAGHEITIDWSGAFKTPRQQFLDTPDGMAATGSKDFKVINVQNTSKTCQDEGSKA